MPCYANVVTDDVFFLLDKEYCIHIIYIYFFFFAEQVNGKAYNQARLLLGKMGALHPANRLAAYVTGRLPVLRDNFHESTHKPKFMPNISPSVNGQSETTGVAVPPINAASKTTNVKTHPLSKCSPGPDA